jgi:hypothetical protein
MTTGIKWAAVLAAVLTFTVAARADDDWINVSSASGKFHFSMPAAPTSSVENDKEAGVPYTQTLYSAKTDVMIAIGLVTDYQSDSVKVDMGLIVSSMIKAFGGELVSNEPAPYDKAPAQELEGALVTFQSDKLYCKVRFAIDGTQVYGLGGCIALGSSNEPLLDRELASFQITP